MIFVVIKCFPFNCMNLNCMKFLLFVYLNSIIFIYFIFLQSHVSLSMIVVKLYEYKWTDLVLLCIDNICCFETHYKLWCQIFYFIAEVIHISSSAAVAAARLPAGGSSYSTNWQGKHKTSTRRPKGLWYYCLNRLTPAEFCHPAYYFYLSCLLLSLSQQGSFKRPPWNW